MTILESNDNELRRLIFEKDRVIVKFIDEDCPVCRALAPTFQNFASNPDYQNITFVRMNAKENPVSSKEVKMSGTPFFAIYRNGTLKDCGIVSTEDGLRDLLQKLL
ncbi:thioredoxin family protein [Pontibacter silvestris]|uniref:Thioredoxin family protein n=1 Tax=Pontibacter silvestris TaxID=2305183 RepID=A0ABW4WXL1_9BACT|nr:thioredoxin family protein [Pontibacter silvestris]MCC9136520.1 thioredoxin family protein [Pontibacter silvestris]